MIVGKPFKVSHNSKKGYKWVVTRICDECGNQKDVQETGIIQRQERDGFILCNSCKNKKMDHAPRGAYKDKKCFKKDGKWLITRICADCGDKQDVACSSIFSKCKNNITILCWKCSQKNRKLPRGEDDGHWKHGITKNGYKRINVEGNRVLLHRYIAEKEIGRKLSARERVHHIDLNKLNNCIDNLYIYASMSEHGKGHMSLEKSGFQLFCKKIWYDATHKEYTLFESKQNERTFNTDLLEYKTYTKSARGATYVFWWDSKNQQARRYHVMLAEKIIGRPLKRNESVHHIDGNTLNNSLTNLSVMFNKQHKKCHYSLQKCVAQLYKDGDIIFQDGLYKIKECKM